MSGTRATRHAGRGRRAILWSGALFLLVQLVAGLLIDYRWPEVRFPSIAGTLKILSNQKRSPDVLILGSSRFGAACIPTEMRSRLRELTGDPELQVFNGSIEAGDLVTADHELKRILEQGIEPKLVVVEISPETLARRNEWLGQHLIRQVTWADVPSYLGDVNRTGNYLPLLSTRLMPLYLHRRQICRQVYSHIEPGWLRDLLPEATTSNSLAEEQRGVRWESLLSLNNLKLTPDQRTQSGLHTIRRWLKDYQVGGGAAAALDRLIQRCEDNDIDLVLIGVPVSKPHRDLYAPEIDRAFLTHVKAQAARHHLRFFDYRDKLTDTQFLDNHHVNRDGGMYFSRRLTEEVIAPIWRAQREDVRRASLR